MKQIKIKIEGMTCGGCVSSVQKALQAVVGVEAISVSLEDGLAVVAYDESNCDVPAIVEAIEEAGFDTQLVQLIMQLKHVWIDFGIPFVEKISP